MTADDHPENRDRDPLEEPVEAVPEADALDQRTAAGPEAEEDWLAEARDQPLDQAAEADVADQLRDAGDDDEDEWR